MNLKNFVFIALGLILGTFWDSFYRSGFCHHTDLQETVCFLYTDWDPPTDSRCVKEGENTSGIPVFSCCGPR